MSYYECHVTLDPSYSLVVQPIAVMHKFKMSVLKGDEIMGDDQLMYCTCHERSFDVILGRMDELIDHLTAQQIPVLRKKIEHVLVDERYR